MVLKNTIRIIGIFVITIAFTACNQNTEPAQSTVNFFGPTPTYTPAPPPTPTVATPSPVPSPTPTVYKTPTPSKPEFFAIRHNMDLMTEEQKNVYMEELNGKKVEHWIGVVKDKPLLDDGYYAITIEMDPQPAERPDLVLTKIDEAVLETIEAGQQIRFSGTISGFTNVYEQNNILAFSDAVIHSNERKSSP